MVYKYLFFVVFVALAVKVTSADLIHGKYTENPSLNWQANPIWGTGHFSRLSKFFYSYAYLEDNTESSVCVFFKLHLVKGDIPFRNGKQYRHIRGVQFT